MLSKKFGDYFDADQLRKDIGYCGRKVYTNSEPTFVVRLNAHGTYTVNLKIPELRQRGYKNPEKYIGVAATDAEGQKLGKKALQRYMKSPDRYWK